MDHSHEGDADTSHMYTFFMTVLSASRVAIPAPDILEKGAIRLIIKWLRLFFVLDCLSVMLFIEGRNVIRCNNLCLYATNVT